MTTSVKAEKARVEALRAWAYFWAQHPDEAEASEVWKTVAGSELAHFFVRMSPVEARHVLDVLRKWDEPEHSQQEREALIQQLRELGLRQPAA